MGSQEVRITAVRLLDRAARVVTEVKAGQFLRVEIDYETALEAINPIFGLTLSTDEGQIACNLTTVASGVIVPTLRGRGCLAVEFERLDLCGGRYFVDVGCYERDWSHAYDYHWHLYPLLINGPPGNKGILSPPTRWEMLGRRMASVQNRS
jgi:lipopolysaccharide transport system ATP-binding protein